MCYDPHESQKDIEAEERKFNREYEEEQERLREEETEREIKEMEDVMEEKIENCFNCGNENPSVCTTDDEHGNTVVFCVGCSNCHFYGQGADTREDAIKNWNHMQSKSIVNPSH
jgi:MinD superfamily P-loop ATPase